MRGASDLCENQIVSSGSLAAMKGRGKVVPPELAILLQICGNFGQPAPDRELGPGAEPGQ